MPNTSTYALTNVTLPYALSLANNGWREALKADPALALGLNNRDGTITTLAQSPRHMGSSIGSWPTSSAEAPTMVGVVQTYLDHLTVERGMSRNTVAAYGRDLRRYADYLAELGITDPPQVTSAMIGNYAARLREGVAAPDGAGWWRRPGQCECSASRDRSTQPAPIRIYRRPDRRRSRAEHPAVEATSAAAESPEPGAGPSHARASD